jgi:hypothetical protein
MPNSEFRMQHAECERRLSVHRRHVRPSSLVLRPSPPRRGVTIVEVLFAILITTVGLFSAMAIFPFASAQARRARLNDMFAAAGRSAFHSFDARGMRRPDRWLAWDQRVNAGNGAFVPYLSLSNRQTHEAVCIDPRLIGKHTRFVGSNQILNSVPVTRANGQPGFVPAQFATFLHRFPYGEPYEETDYNGACDTSEGPLELNLSAGHDPPQMPHPSLGYPRNGPPNNLPYDTSLMRRITLRTASGSNYAMSLLQANRIFISEDDISYDRDEEDKSKPASQSTVLLQSAASLNEWAKRNSEGQLSWIATLVPQYDVSGAPNDNYTLSIVMIHGRTDLRLETVDKMSERTVNGQLDGTGASGGEIVLASPDRDQLKLKPHDWVMLSGTYFPVVGQPNQPPQPISRFQWYRVSDCDIEPEEISTGVYALNATLIGQDWNMNYVALPLPPNQPGGRPGDVRVTIVEGAFAVYEKTVRLEYGSAF